MGVEILSNKDDTYAVLFCNTADVSVEDSTIMAPRYYDIDNDDRGATEFAEEFLDFCFGKYGDPRSLCLQRIVQKFVHLKSTETDRLV